MLGRSSVVCPAGKSRNQCQKQCASARSAAAFSRGRQGIPNHIKRSTKEDQWQFRHVYTGANKCQEMLRTSGFGVSGAKSRLRQGAVKPASGPCLRRQRARNPEREHHVARKAPGGAPSASKTLPVRSAESTGSRGSALREPPKRLYRAAERVGFAVGLKGGSEGGYLIHRWQLDEHYPICKTSPGPPTGRNSPIFDG